MTEEQAGEAKPLDFSAVAAEPPEASVEREEDAVDEGPAGDTGAVVPEDDAQ